MKLIRGGNCMLASAAMCLDRTYAEMLVRVHRVHDIAWPQATGQLRERGVTIDEINDLRIKMFLTVNILPFRSNGVPGCDPVPVYSEEVAVARWRDYMSMFSGIVQGQTDDGIGHAIAWDNVSQLFYDPRGYITDFEGMQLSPQTFYAMLP